MFANRLQCEVRSWAAASVWSMSASDSRDDICSAYGRFSFFFLLFRARWMIEIESIQTRFFLRFASSNIWMQTQSLAPPPRDSILFFRQFDFALLFSFLPPMQLFSIADKSPAHTRHAKAYRHWLAGCCCCTKYSMCIKSE